jgi:hypothetical protein
MALALCVGCLCASAASAATPNDPSFGLQWADSNTGQSIPTQSVEGEEPLGPPANGTAGADERALAAWDVTTGSRSIVVGELDSGVQFTHPDLAANIWSNPGGIGGCPAGTHGYDAVSDTCYPQDEDTSYGGHGTHVAGIIGAVGNNGAGVAGLNWKTSILAVKWVQSAGWETDELANALKWLLSAKEQGVNIRVVNDSLTFSGTAYSPEVKRAIEALGEHNILFVTAAGNSGDDDDEESVRRYPCGYHLANEICVTAVNNRDELPWWANYGPHTVDLAAPGASIYSTLREGRYGYLSGGSMAAAQVSGAAALIASAEPGASAAELKSDILDNARPLASLKGKVTTGATLDVCRAMPGCELPPRPGVTTLAASSITQASATLNATVDPNGSQVSACHFEYGSSSAYGASAACTPTPGAGNAAVHVSAQVSGLSAKSTYHYRVVASNAGGTSAGADQTLGTQPNAPAITGEAVAQITQTTATLKASVNPEGAAVSGCRFEYGSGGLQASVPCVPAPGSGESPVAVSASIGELAPNTAYRFRVVASNAGGTETSQEQSFTTLPEAPSANTEAATGITQTSATLHASVNPNGGALTTCQFEYGRTSAYGSRGACAPAPGSGESPVAVLVSVTGLAANTSYHFRIVAANSGGEGVGGDEIFATLATPAGGEQPLRSPPQPISLLPKPVAAGAQKGALAYSQVTPPPALPTLLTRTLAVDSRHVVHVRLACLAQQPCVGTIAVVAPVPASRRASGIVHRARQPVTRSLVRITAGLYDIPAGGARSLALVVSGEGRRLLARSRRLHAQLSLTASGVASSGLTVAVTLRARGRL